MPDFTNLDPNIIAKYWIYVIGFFIVGFAAGFILNKFLFKRSRSNFEDEKERFNNTKTNNKSLEEKCIKLQTELQDLKDSIKDSQEYWLYIRDHKHNDDEFSDINIHDN